RRTRSDRFQDRARSDREGALRESDRSAVRIHRSRCRPVEDEPERNLQLSQTASQTVRGAHIPEGAERGEQSVMPMPDWLRHRRSKPQEAEEAALWSKCPKCSEVLYRRDLSANLWVCPRCDHHFRMTAFDRINALVDAD